MKRKRIPTKKGRKKLLGNLPTNYTFWCFTIDKAESLQQFLERGSDRQKNCAVRALNYMRKYNKERFEKANGEYWLTAFKNTLHEK